MNYYTKKELLISVPSYLISMTTWSLHSNSCWNETIIPAVLLVFSFCFVACSAPSIDSLDEED